MYVFSIPSKEPTGSKHVKLPHSLLCTMCVSCLSHVIHYSLRRGVLDPPYPCPRRVPLPCFFYFCFLCGDMRTTISRCALFFTAATHGRTVLLYMSSNTCGQHMAAKATAAPKRTHRRLFHTPASR